MGHPAFNPHPSSMVRPENRPSLKQRLAGLRYVLRLVPLLWESHRGYASTMIALRLVSAFVPVSTLWVAKLIVDEVVRSLSQGPNYPRLWQLIALELGIAVAGDLLNRASGVVDRLLG